MSVRCINVYPAAQQVQNRFSDLTNILTMIMMVLINNIMMIVFITVNIRMILLKDVLR